MSKVLITGGAGYIGDCAVQHLIWSGHTVTVLDNLIYGGAYMRRSPRLFFVRGDVRDKALVEREVLHHDSVLHLAALVGDGACAVNPQETIEVNEEATRHIAELCKKHNKRMVFASTCSVYGANNDLLDEDSPTNPLSVYAGTKLKAEKYVREVPEHYICRLGTLFGLGTEHARLRCDLVVNILTYKACSGQPITVFGGEQWRPLLHVKDAGEIMALCCVRELKTQPFGTRILYNSNWQILDVAKSIMQICSLPKDKLQVTDMRFEDQRNYRVKSKNPYLRHRMRSLDKGIKEMADVMIQGRIANIWDDRFHNARYIAGRSK